MARYTTGNAIKAGLLMRLPCEICGTTEKVEAHHHDYMKPFDIKWLCKKHHDDCHKSLNIKEGIKT